MTWHDPVLPPDPYRLTRGGAPVADLRTLDGFQALSVMLFRDWFDGDEGRARVAHAFETALDGQAGTAALTAWEEMMDVLSHGVRRPLMRHDLTCRCVGADEAIVAQILTLAARAEREDAMLILSLLVPAERLLPATHIAQRAGLAVMRIDLRTRRRRRGPAKTPDRLH
ncbi:hypothetical protein [Jannaschia donghaensis]|uniref:Uncharacterized protein n=1 Tax=Jannaschia donghaensis TaxID=420998 RepID=A0A0M6YQD5_9RHOB|nr:hypothetical protein [Jannaschia donghaensis]CTQ51457.1 hypothetical protein JDO7802_03497 [Jannaschia donghaensis]